MFLLVWCFSEESLLFGIYYIYICLKLFKSDFVKSAFGPDIKQQILTGFILKSDKGFVENIIQTNYK